MRSRGRVLWLAGSGLFLVIVALGFLFLPRAPRFTRDNFDRIRVGMSSAEVEALLGPPGNYLTGPVADSPMVQGDPALVALPGVSWRGDDGIISLEFDASGKVAKKLFVPVVRLDKEPQRMHWQEGPAPMPDPPRPARFGPRRYGP
jgi:hypothetical protein